MVSYGQLRTSAARQKLTTNHTAVLLILPLTNPPNLNLGIVIQLGPCLPHVWRQACQVHFIEHVGLGELVEELQIGRFILDILHHWRARIGVWFNNCVVGHDCG